MLRFKIREKLSRRLYPSLFHVFEALANSFLCIGTCRNIEQALVGFGILDDGCSFPFDNKDNGPPGLFELSHEVTGPSAECCQRLNIFRDVEHGAPV